MFPSKPTRHSYRELLFTCSGLIVMGSLALLLGVGTCAAAILDPDMPGPERLVVASLGEMLVVGGITLTAIAVRFLRHRKPPSPFDGLVAFLVRKWIWAVVISFGSGIGVIVWYVLRAMEQI